MFKFRSIFLCGAIWKYWADDSVKPYTMKHIRFLHSIFARQRIAFTKIKQVKCNYVGNQYVNLKHVYEIVVTGHNNH